MSIAQAVKLIITAINAAAAATIQQFESFFGVLLGEVEYIASYFGYNGPGSPAQQQADNIAEILADESLGFANVAAILNIVEAIKAELDAGVPATLPTTPPPGYGGPTGPAMGDAVWSADLTGNMEIAGNFLAKVGRTVIPTNDTPFRTPIDYRAHLYFSLDWADTPLGSIPTPDPSTFEFTLVPLDPTFTLQQQLQAQAPPDVMVGVFLDGSCWWIDNATGGEYYYDLTEAEWQVIQGHYNPKPSLPAWPGIDRVTLLVASALSEDTVLTGPMDGVLVNITSWPAGKSTIQYDGLTSILRIGALTFVSDHGEAEFIQALSLDKEVYCPKVMASAASAIIRAAPGVEGTVRGWVTT